MRARCKCMGGVVQSPLWSSWYRWNSFSIGGIKPLQKLLKMSLSSTSGIYSLQWKLESPRDFFRLPARFNPRFVWEQNSVKMLFPSSRCTEQSKSPNVVSLMYTDLSTKNNSFLKEGSQSTWVFGWDCFYSATIIYPCSQSRFDLEISESHPAIFVVSFKTRFL